jgi:patatin-like phospholipase/acyl hydrolase
VKRILAIDGGGMNGLMAAYVLAHLEDRTGEPSHDSWDLIAGVSTGGIIAAALAIGVPARDIVKLYQEQGPRIFSRSLWHRLRTLWGLRGPKYPATGLEKALRAHLGAQWLSDARTNLLVTAFDRGTGCLVDGGVGAVNPALFAWREARTLWPGEDVLLLSIAAAPRGSDGLKFYKSHRADDPDRDEELARVGYATAAAPTFFPALEATPGGCQGEPKGMLGWGPRIPGTFIAAGVDAVDHILKGIMPPEDYFRVHPEWSGALDDATPGNLQWLHHTAKRIVGTYWEELEEVAARVRGAVALGR